MGCGITSKSRKISPTSLENPKIIYSQSLADSKKKMHNIRNCYIRNLHSNLNSDFQILYQFDNGSFAKAFKVKEIKTGIERIMKVLKLETIKEEIENVKDDLFNNFQDLKLLNFTNKRIAFHKESFLEFDKNYFIKEIEILKQLDHPNVIKIFDYYVDSLNIYIIMESFSGFDLFEEISNWKLFTEERACYLLYQILLSINYLHSKSVIHRDLKPENIIIRKENLKNARETLNENIFFFEHQKYELNKSIQNTTNNNNNNKINNLNDLSNNSLNPINFSSQLVNFKHNNFQESRNFAANFNSIKSSHINNFNLKIIDYGTGKILKKNNLLCSPTETLHYVAPEIINKNYDEKVDIWACGIIFYIMLVGYLPFDGRTTDKILNNISNGKYDLNNSDWKKISYEIKHLLRCMLTYDPNKRISAFDALNHVVFNKISNTPYIPRDIKTIKNSLERIRLLNFISKFRQATLNYLIKSSAIYKETEELKFLFQSKDINRDGRISYSELKDGCEYIYGQSLYFLELRMLMESLNNDKSGYLEYDEFIKALRDKMLLFDEEKLKIAFHRLNMNEDSKITREELIKTFIKNVEKKIEINKPFHEEDITEKMTSHNQAIININDFNVSDYGISFEEFKNLMLNNIKNIPIEGIQCRLVFWSEFAQIQNVHISNDKKTSNTNSKKIKQHNKVKDFGNRRWNSYNKISSKNESITKFNLKQSIKTSSKKKQKNSENGGKLSCVEEDILTLQKEDKSKYKHRYSKSMNLFLSSQNFEGKNSLTVTPKEIIFPNKCMINNLEKIEDLTDSKLFENINNNSNSDTLEKIFKNREEHNVNDLFLPKVSSFIASVPNKICEDFLSEGDHELFSLKVSKTLNHIKSDNNESTDNQFYFKRIKKNEGIEINLLNFEFDK